MKNLVIILLITTCQTSVYDDWAIFKLNREFNARLTKLKTTAPRKKVLPLPYNPLNLSSPEQMDWKEKGAVTPVKNQGRCGSCWAFSTTGSLEGQNFLRNGRLVSLSEQNLLDCSGLYGNEGCEGGLIVNSIQYVIENGGINAENVYPYKGQTGPCRFVNGSLGATASGYVEIPAGDEAALKNAVAYIGPISAGMHALGHLFQFYAGGVYVDSNCRPEDINHAVLVTGYGTENGLDYWLIKNSMSEAWGEMGYVKLLREQNNHCGIASMACYPVV